MPFKWLRLPKFRLFNAFWGGGQMSNSKFFRGVLGLAAALLAMPVVAQQETAFLEEIVVTSTKRQSTLQEIPVAVSVVQADDLKQIKGVGPKMEQLCNSLGFWHFDQVAGWNADEVA